ncbi:MAG: cation:proton antiporter [Sulfurovaceae bacterium]|nr:cation:proton antiporter [Sulfurovaceae bacterium]
MEHTLFIIVITIAIATLFNVFLKKIKIPTIIGYILSGVIIASIFKFNDSSKDTLSHISQFGVVFLMFTIGLEFSVKHFREMKKEVFIYGMLQVGITGILFSSVSYFLFEANPKTSLIIGFALALSSTAIVLKILNENHETHSGYGRITLGVLLFQDLAVIPILLMISIFTIHNQSLSSLIGELLISAVIVFMAFFIAGKYVTERYFSWIMSTNSEEIFLVSVLLVVISTSFFAESLGFSYSLGAFLAGMILAETKYRYKIEADLVPFRDILLGIFFVAIGIQIDWHSLIKYWHVILSLVVLIMLLKAIIVFMVLSFFVQKRSAMKAALALFQVGEFALVIFTIAYANGMISDAWNQILVISVVMSMFIAPFVLKNIKNIVDFFSPEPTALRKRAFREDSFAGHIIICGYGPLGQRLAANFRDMNLFYIILEHDITLVDKAIAGGEEMIFLANAAQKNVLEHFNIEESVAVVIAIRNEKHKRLICENIISIDTNINTVVTVNNDEEEKIIREIGIKHIVNDRQIISEMLTQKALSCSLRI